MFIKIHNVLIHFNNYQKRILNWWKFAQLILLVFNIYLNKMKLYEIIYIVKRGWFHKYFDLKCLRYPKCQFK